MLNVPLSILQGMSSSRTRLQETGYLLKNICPEHHRYNSTPIQIPQTETNTTEGL